MTLRGVFALCLSAILLSGCGATTKPAAKSALTAMDDILKVGQKAPLDDLSRQSADLRNLPDGFFSKPDLAKRNALLVRSESLVVDLSILGIDTALVSQKVVGSQQAKLITTSALSTSTTWKQKFVTDFTEVTTEVITDVACGKILDQIAPDQQPTIPGAATPAESATQDAVAKLAARQWPATGYRDLVDWVEYVESVAKNAEQFAQAIDGYSATYIVALGNPGVRKAVLVYLRTCYSPPKPFPAG